ncbi:response regulator [Acidocella sp. MX-AZ03]|uniref:response regulator n=1 Tax=Acidocella sp. MX-AZ03 TaxID=2697363 RepID=UPI0022DE1640|nr:response regulator [Acidocella sp. MX-AZ03]WBO59795.1 response regulator [Acidocella sp. MX-AZ03]
MRILLIEDDKNVVSFVLKGMREAGHNVIHAESAQAGRERAARESFDVIILDRMLPEKEDGLVLLSHLRAQKIETPVLILSGLGEPTNKVAGLRAGGMIIWRSPSRFRSCWRGSRGWRGVAGSPAAPEILK